jgi:hypothetical protein
MKKIFITFIISLILFSTLSAQEKNYIVQDNIDIYAGVHYQFDNFKFDKANNLQNSRMLFIGMRLKTLKDAICLNMDYSFATPYQDLNYKFVGSMSLDLSIIRFEKSYISLGIKWQNMNLSFDNVDNNVLNKYTIDKLNSLGPSLRFKNRAFNVEIGYLFGLNNRNWIDKTSYSLYKEKVNSFYMKASINLALLK